MSLMTSILSTRDTAIAENTSMRIPILALVSALFLAQTPRPAPFTSPYSEAELANKQAVVETTMGTFVIQLLPDAAPNHVAHFIKTARDGGYAGTIFHRVIRYGIIQ